ncbi:oxysterol binding protein [Apiospora kogelbergensis]|uniref:Oxysterol binding protein n=1 Tax=Apiospora kogelbergensis TaxID=1337665 RepID=A0AAW0Q8W4_9PEZI
MASTTAAPETLNEDIPQNDSGKLRTFIGILRRFIGVADLAAVRFSLPSQLLEPRPNLEYWTYLDVPNAFAAIGTADEPVDRMLEVLRFWFTKDLKYVKGKPCKPYNSCLGEFFRCTWDPENNAPPINSPSAKAAGNISSASSVKSGKGVISSAASTVSVPPMSENPTSGTTRVAYLTEQTSHHPPVSAFYISCPEKGVHARGYDQISAKFTGTTIKVAPGEHNLGIFITLEKRDNETYQLTHPAAHLGGILRGSLSVSVGEAAFVTCPKTKIKVILQYLEDGWLGRAQNKVEGVIFRYDPEKDDKTRIKDVPDKDVLVRLSGNWKEKIVFTHGPKPVDSHPPEKQTVIIDLNPLEIAPKTLPPMDKQAENESLTMWDGVTQAIHSKQFSKATTVKQELEEKQREKAREREKNNVTWQPVFFSQVTDKGGKPELSEKGRQLLERIHKGDWSLEGIS